MLQANTWKGLAEQILTLLDETIPLEQSNTERLQAKLGTMKEHDAKALAVDLLKLMSIDPRTIRNVIHTHEFRIDMEPPEYLN